jgi:membrane-bound serine protease (ClpP class)
MLIVAIVMSYDHYGAEGGNVALVIALILSSIMWWWWATHFQNTRYGKRMTLQTSVDGKTATHCLAEFVGQSGTAVTDLRPAGTVVIDGRRVDAISDGEFIENGQTVRVLRAQGICIIVRRSV